MAYARNLAALGLHKQAEDAINPAQISAGKTDAVGATPPKGASPSEEGVPSEPSDVNAQKSKMLSSNEAAINFTKRDAKADPKGDVNAVLDEKAQTSSTDKVLDEALEHDGGNKLSSADITRVAAARSVLSKLAAAQTPNKKKKQAGSMGPPSDPQTSSGFNAASPM